MNMQDDRLWIIVPCYNEEEVLPLTAPLFLQELNTLIAKKKISSDSRVLFVNDGSRDKTWDIICSLSKQDEHFCGISQSRNRGHQNALLAGLMEAKDRCELTITIDCDGQDDISAMEQMVDEYRKGCDIVYGVRKSRETDTWFKRTTARSFYKLMSKMGVEMIYDHADYRLMGSKALDALSEYKEVNLFLRGIVPLIGFRSDYVYYERNERFAGESKYPLSKMLKFAADGITSFSVKPLKIISNIGIIICLLSIIFFIYALISFFSGGTIAGWASQMCSIWFLGGLQMLSIGIVGTYVGKIYSEVKARPRYTIEKTVINEDYFQVPI